MMNSTEVKLHWLSEDHPPSAGVTWGIPWKEGQLSREDALSLIAGASKAAVPLQSWPAAYWPDGSVKWTGHAAAFLTEPPQDCTLMVGKRDAEQSASFSPLTVRETNDDIVIDTGAILLQISKTGNSIISSMTRNGVTLCTGSELIAIKETVNEQTGSTIIREERYQSRISEVKVEQEGPVRAVVKLTGSHRAVDVDESWLPFSLRMYAYAGLESIRIVHTFVYDGNAEHDFVKGLGISFRIPMQGRLYNRHVRFAGDSGFLSESPKTLHSRRTKGKYLELFKRQLDGETLTDEEMDDDYFKGILDDSARWDQFKVSQLSADHYKMAKRTQAGCSWVKAAEGRRARGVAYVGGSGGGLVLGMRDFWQKHPSGMEAQDMTEDEAQLTAWFWSPDAGAMDMRHYDTETHVESSYEGAEEFRATAYGVGNTNELMIWCRDAAPSSQELEAYARYNESPPQLMCEPAYLRSQGAFGIWSLPDRTTPAKANVEDKLDGIIAFYQREVEQRRWYGFWDYGDFMHSYDPARHVWNYDLGGCAWQNTELVPNMWLWLMFIRTGREDIFRMAEAMTRHTSEVDVYHLGEYAMLGSRHNVVHWGCGCKEARIAMAGLHRYYYYLTGDERIGDMMDDEKDADYATVHLDPMRAYFPKDEHPTHIRVGPDWAAFSSNWMTRWERHEDKFYRDKLMTGIQCIKQANFGLISGPTYGYDPETGILSSMGDDNWGRHLALCMGAPQVWFELSALLKDPQWDEMMADFGVFYNLSQEEKDQITGGVIRTERFEHPLLTLALAAYGAWYRKDKRTADLVWSTLLTHHFAYTDLQHDAAAVTYVREMQEFEWMNTNEASQWSLNAIISLELIGDALPETEPSAGQAAKC
ncbi:hypothetical protein [Paenibacillus lemnae]|uniref:Tat pathway signal sequence domain protein n=1 Tax=Paenibacillus lemnae TaxID=1330551 RepID=A0A848M8K5_PAELE|nr:hypothetical protein [Paenibacillus lemnae]NMO96541.1 hypothetical protein [Paenibacillus lemnae]